MRTLADKQTHFRQTFFCLVSLFASCILLVLSNTAHAVAKKPIALIYTEENLSYVTLFQQTINSLVQHKFSINPINLTEFSCEQFKKPHKFNTALAITVGDESLQETLQCSDTPPLFSTVITHKIYNDLLHLWPAKNGSSALFLDHSLSKQLSLIEAISNQTNHKPTLGIILGPSTAYLEPIVARLTLNRGIPARIVVLEQNDKPIPALRRLLTHCNILLAVPDTSIYNHKTMRGIQLLTLRDRTPIIGYNKSLVKIGALASVYSTKPQHVQEAVASVQRYLNSGSKSLPPPHFPKVYSLKINYSVAHALAIPVENRNLLIQEIDQIEAVRS